MLFRARKRVFGGARRQFSDAGEAYRRILELLSARRAPAAAAEAASALEKVGRKRGSADTRFYARLLGNAHGLAEGWSGNGVEALKALDAAYRETVVGRSHDAYLDIGGLLNDLAIQHCHAAESAPEPWDFNAIEGKLKRALYMAERAYNADGDLVAATLTNLGELHFWRGDGDRAVDYHRRALKLLDADRFLGDVYKEEGAAEPELDDGSSTGLALQTLRESRHVLSRTAAGRTLAMLGEPSDARTALEIISEGIEEAETRLPQGSPLLAATMSGIFRDGALMALVGKAAPANEPAHDVLDSFGPKTPGDVALRALAYAIEAGVADADGRMHLPKQHVAALEGLELSKVEECLHYLIENEPVVAGTHGVRASLWTLAWSLPTEQAKELLSGLRKYVLGDGASAGAFRELDQVAARTSPSTGKVRDGLAFPETLAAENALSRGADVQEEYGAFRAMLVKSVLRQGESKEDRVMWGGGARGVGLRDCSPRALHWQQGESSDGYLKDHSSADAHESSSGGKRGGDKASKTIVDNNMDPYAL